MIDLKKGKLNLKSEKQIKIASKNIVPFAITYYSHLNFFNGVIGKTSICVI